MKSVSPQAAIGVIWAGASQAVRLVSQVLGLVVLARLLPPADFGVVAMALVATGFALLFRDLGTNAAIIQQQQLSQRLLDSVFLLNVVVGTALAGLFCLLAPLLAWFFAEPRLREILWLLALVFPLSSLGLVQQALFERASDFRTVALIESAAAVAGLVAAVAAAYAGWGVYSLVLPSLLSAAITVLCLWTHSKWRPTGSGSLREIRQLWRFSGHLVGFNFFNYFARNADNILIGRMLGSTDLGYYTMAYRLMLWPVQNISAVLCRALFPVLSRLQQDTDRLASAYLKTTAAIALITAPMMLGLFVLREPFVGAVLGPQWAPVAGLLAWLAPVGLLQAIGTTVGTVYLSTGRTDVMFRWGVFGGTVIILSFAIGIHWGLLGLVLGYVAAMVLLILPSLHIALRLIGLPVSHVLKEIFPSVLIACAMAAIVAYASHAALIGSLDVGPRLVTLTCLGILVYAMLTWIFQRRLLYSIIHVLKNRE